MVIREARKGDVESLNVDTHGCSLRALVVENDGEALAIAGVIHTNPLQCFSVMTPAVRRSPKTIVKTALRLRQLLDSYTGEVFALADENEPNSPRFLEFVGFVHYLTNHQGEIYQWPQHSQH